LVTVLTFIGGSEAGARTHKDTADNFFVTVE
jgi:hypothetical protein